jgi:phage terminase small subunit
MADKLTPKQERFAQLIAGGNDQSTAYREAFNSNGKDSTVHSEASRLMKNPKVSARVEQITEQKHRAISRKAVTDRELVVGKLRRWTEDGIDPTTGDEPTQAQLTAAQLLGRTVALFSDKVEQITTERTADEVAAEIKRRLAVAAESEQDGEPLH